MSGDWKLIDKTHIAVRDTAANIISAFNQPGCHIIDTDCINHVLQLSIKDEVFDQKNVKNLNEKFAKLNTYDSHSNKLNEELKKQQILVMGKSESECLCLIKDVKTRWNYTCLMYERAIKLEPALILAMRNCYDNIGVEFIIKR